MSRQSAPPYQPMKFNRLELAGSLGDLGTLLPIAMGMIMINQMSSVGIFFAIGLFYILAGSYFRIPIAVQPMKIIGAYAIATGMSNSEISSATLIIGILLIILGFSGFSHWIGKVIPTQVVRGVQLSTGILLMKQGMYFLLGTSDFQKISGAAEPLFTMQHLGPIPLGLSLGIIGACITLFFLSSTRYPAALLVIGFGLIAGLIFGDYSELSTLRPGIFFPDFLPFGIPDIDTLTIGLLVLTLPQLPMTLGNAVIATTDLSHQYFQESANRVTCTSTTLSMGFANLICFFIGSMPLCHGAGGLAAHYRFGARTSGSNIIIGMIFLILALFFGPQAITLLQLLPMSILGVLLIFAGAQLGLTVVDMMNRQDMFVLLVMLTITLATNLAWAFLVGTVLWHLLQRKNFSL